MIHLFINALAATAGGGLTYVRNVLPRLALRHDLHTTILVGETLRDEIAKSPRVTVPQENIPASPGRRFWHEQRALPEIIRRAGADVLLSTGNFALYNSPVPQILLSGNTLYTSTDFLRDLRDRGDHRLWLDTEIKGELARWSIRTADCTVAPSETFARELRQWTGKDVVSIHHGFDRELFFRDKTRMPHLQSTLAATEGSLKLLFVSHYNYYRNFETLIRATAILKRELRSRSVRLLLTCKLDSKDNPGSYHANTASELVQRLRLQEQVVELGTVPYGLLHQLYRACDLYVTPAYAETFAHPLVEAMASGLPVIASDLRVHKEICGDAAQYFPRFSSEALAECVIRIAGSPEKSASMREKGLLRSRDFSWDDHVERILQLVSRMARPDSKLEIESEISS